MVAAAHVNVHYLLILLLPSVIAVVMVALTWYYRAGRRGDPGAKSGRPSDKRNSDASAAKPGRSPAAKSSRSPGRPPAKPGRRPAAKRRHK